MPVHLRLDFMMEANNMNPDLTAPFGSSLIWVNIVCNIGYRYTKLNWHSLIFDIIRSSSVHHSVTFGVY